MSSTTRAALTGLTRTAVPSHDAEYAFQAAFVVLAQKADRVRTGAAGPTGRERSVPRRATPRRGSTPLGRI